MNNKKNIAIYLVSLNSDLERRNNLAKQFPNFFGNMIHIEAVDGREMDAKSYFNKVLPNFQENNRLMSPAELGCTLSHIQALESFLKTDNKHALIIEDDILGSDKDIENIFNLISSLDQYALLICGGQEGTRSTRYVVGKEINNDGLWKISSFSYPYILRTCCYVVTRASAEQILNRQKEMLVLADDWSYFFKDTISHIFYSGHLSHPVDLSNSHIEIDRKNFKQKSVLKNALSFLFLKRAVKRMYRELGLVVNKFFGFKRLF
ncbi:MAG: glycosyltransferase family 25 protein [Methyloprofundus sp.]|nr:glycosyltransferase family 25 protein [Methyloprofundus sp.]